MPYSISSVLDSTVVTVAWSLAQCLECLGAGRAHYASEPSSLILALSMECQKKSRAWQPGYLGVSRLDSFGGERHGAISHFANPGSCGILMLS